MKRFKYITSFVIAAIVLIASLPVTAFADGAQEVVTPDSEGVTNPAASIELVDPSADSWFYLYSFAGTDTLVWPDETYNYYENSHTVTLKLTGEDPTRPCDDRLAVFSGNECDVVTRSCDETGGDIRQVTVAQGGYAGGAGYTAVTSSGATAAFYAYNLPIPSKVKLSRTSADLPVNRIMNLTSPQTGVWESDNPEVATVSQSGMVTGKSNGIAHITLTYTEYGLHLVGTCTVKVGTGIDANAEKVTFTSYDIAAYRLESMGTPPDGEAGTDGGMLRLEAHFPAELTLTDADAAADSFVVSNTSTVNGTDYSYVSVNGNTLTLDMSVTFMPGGILKFNTGEIAGVTCAGLPIYWPEDFQTVVPTGLAFHPVNVTVGTDTTPASTTVRIDKSAKVRSMNHILWTSNGSSILSGVGTDQTTPAHHHNYWSFTLGTSAESIKDGGASVNGYTVTAANDTVTITADTPMPGEYLGIYNYDDDFLQENGFGLADHVEGLASQLVYEKLRIADRCTITLPKAVNWTGEAICPDVTIVDGYNNGTYQYQLQENTDYTITYSNNIDKGSVAAVTITGMGDYLGSRVVKNFTITSPLEASMFVVDTSSVEFKAAAWKKEISSPAGLTEGVDYLVNYYNNAFPGTAQIVISGTGAYSGTLTYEFTITPKDTAEETSSGEDQKDPCKTLGHTTVKDAAVAATVFKTGKTAGSHCSVCGTILKAQKTVKKLTPSIKLSAAKKTVKVKKSFTLKVTKLAKGDAIKKVTSSKSSIAAVKKTAAGKYKITGKKAGKATITVVLKSGKTAKCKVTVKK